MCFFFCRRPLPFGGSHLRLPSGPAGIRTTTGSLSALARPTPYQLSHRVASLEATCASLHQTELLTGIISAQDRRALQTACGCLNSLRIRVEALANVTERAVISQQLQLIQTSAQMHPTEDLHTDNISCLSRSSVQHFDANKAPGQTEMLKK